MIDEKDLYEDYICPDCGKCSELCICKNTNKNKEAKHMKYQIILKRYNTLDDIKTAKYDPVEDGIKAMESLKSLTETFSTEINEGTVRIYLTIIV